MIEFTIPGRTQAQERPRFSRAGGFVKTHDAPRYRACKEVVKLVAWEHKPQKPISEAIKLEVDYILFHQKI